MYVASAYLEDDANVVSERIRVCKRQLQGDSVGVEERTRLCMCVFVYMCVCARVCKNYIPFNPG